MLGLLAAKLEAKFSGFNADDGWAREAIPHERRK